MNFALFVVLGSYAGETDQNVPLTQVISDGGWTMAVLGVLSVLTTFMVVYFLFTLRENMVLPTAFLTEAKELSESGDVGQLCSLCNNDSSPGAGIVGAAAGLLRDNPGIDYLVIRDVIEDEGSRQSNAIWQKIQYLMDIAVTAPMVGLLGTVLGMIQAFVGLQQDFGTVKPTALANGVSKALVTTAGGLILGIAAMLFYSYFRGRVSGLIAKLEENSNMILRNIVFKRK